MSTSTDSNGYSADESGYITARPRPTKSHQTTDLDSDYDPEEYVSPEVSSQSGRSSPKPSEEPPVPVVPHQASQQPDNPYPNAHTGRARTRAQARISIPPSTRFSFRMPTPTPSQVVTGLSPAETQQLCGMAASLQTVQARLSYQGEILSSMTELSHLNSEGMARALENSKAARDMARRMEMWCALGGLLVVMMFLVIALALYLG